MISKRIFLLHPLSPNKDIMLLFFFHGNKKSMLHLFLVLRSQLTFFEEPDFASHVTFSSYFFFSYAVSTLVSFVKHLSFAIFIIAFVFAVLQCNVLFKTMPHSTLRYDSSLSISQACSHFSLSWAFFCPQTHPRRSCSTEFLVAAS